VLEWLARYPRIEIPEPSPARDTVVVTGDPALLDSRARRNWLIGDAKVDAGFDYQQVGVAWPL
jgi:hypothetical protein